MEGRRIATKTFGEIVLTTAVALIMHLLESGIGKLDAKLERYLKEVWVETPSYHEAIGQKKWLFTGEKGTGKSALFQYLDGTKFDNNQWNNTVIVKITLDDILKSDLLPEQITEEDTDMTWSVINSRKFWKANLLFHSASNYLQIKKENDEINSSCKKLAKELKLKLKNDFKENLTSLLSRFDIEWEGAGFKINLKDKNEKVKKEQIDKQWNLLLETLKSNNDRILLMIDELDLHWNGSKSYISLISGLLSEIYQTIPDENNINKNIWVYLYLRSDIYRHSKQDMEIKVKLEDFKSDLNWNKELLKDLFKKRIDYFGRGKISSELFFQELGRHETSEWEGYESPFDYILSLIYWHPRDIIILFNRVFDQVMRQYPQSSKENPVILSRQHFEDNLYAYGLKIVDEFTMEYKIDLQRVFDFHDRDNLIRLLRKICENKGFLQLDKFKDKIGEDLKLKSDEILNLLCRMGIIGFEDNAGNLKFYYHFEDRGSDEVMENILKKRKIHFHRGLHNLLNISKN